jgi:hypothetical protein
LKLVSEILPFHQWNAVKMTSETRANTPWLSVAQSLVGWEATATTSRSRERQRLADRRILSLRTPNRRWGSFLTTTSTRTGWRGLARPNSTAPPPGERGPRPGSQAIGRAEPADGARLRDGEAVQSPAASTRATPAQPDSGPTIPHRSRMPASDGPPTPRQSTSASEGCGSDPPTCLSLDSSTLTTASGIANS